MRKIALIVSAAAGLAALPSAAMANVDYSGITGSVSWTDAIAAMVTVGGTVALVLVARKGIRFVLAALK